MTVIVSKYVIINETPKDVRRKKNVFGRGSDGGIQDYVDVSAMNNM